MSNHEQYNSVEDIQKSIKKYLVDSMRSIRSNLELYAPLRQSIKDSGYDLQLDMIKDQVDTLITTHSISRELSELYINAILKIHFKNDSYTVLSVNIFSEYKKICIKVLPEVSNFDIDNLKSFEQISIIDSKFDKEVIIPIGIKRLILNDSDIPLINTRFNEDVEMIHYNYWD